MECKNEPTKEQGRNSLASLLDETDEFPENECEQNDSPDSKIMNKMDFLTSMASRQHLIMNKGSPDFAGTVAKESRSFLHVTE